ncbi:MAG: hypothetical protein ACHP9U_01875 [Steroidobacterales bacterium]|jgi:hypothetical protein
MPVTQPPSSQALFTAAIVALIAWRMYARIRRSIGRQRLSPVRPWVSVTLFPLLGVLLALSVRALPVAEGCLAAGAAVGIGLGVLGLRLTRFEQSPEGLYYTPSAHLGVILSTLLLCRIAYRFVTGGFPGAAVNTPPPSANALTPLTLLLLGTLAGYYACYAAGLLRWAARCRSAAA